MALSFRAASGGQGAAAVISPITVTLPTGWAANDLIYLSVSMAIDTNPSFTTPTGWSIASAWTGEATGVNGGIVFYRTMQSGDTLTSVTFSGTGGKYAWVMIALQPGAGATAVHSGAATPTVVATASTTHTAPAYAAGADTGVSVLMFATKASTNTGLVVSETAVPTSYTLPTNGAQSTNTGNQATQRQVAAHVNYRTGQTGTITPGAATITCNTAAVHDIINHLFAIEQTAGTTAAAGVASGTGVAYDPTVTVDPPNAPPPSQPTLFNRVPIVRAANF